MKPDIKYLRMICAMAKEFKILWASMDTIQKLKDELLEIDKDYEQ